jgi:hypothetical protein
MFLFSGSSAIQIKRVYLFDIGHAHHYYDDLKNKQVLDKVY